MKQLALLIASLVCLMGCRHTEPFYPIGIYGAHDMEAFTAVRNAGFNTVVSYATPEKLETADQLGLRILSPIGANISKELNIPKIQRFIDSTDQHPALLGYYLVDEPDLNLISPDRVQEIHRYFKAYPVHKPTALIVYNGFNAKDYSEITDIFMIDRYPIPWLPLADFDLHMRLASNAIPRDKPLYTVLQAFDWENHKQMLPNETVFRPPTTEEMRCMVYLSLSYGADGIFFYSYRSGDWFSPEHQEVWEGLKSITYEMIQRKPLFLGTPISVMMDGETLPYQVRLNEALSPTVRAQVIEVKKGNNFVEEGRYLLAVNTTEKELKWRWKWRGLKEEDANLSSIVVLDEFRVLATEGGWFEDTFGPYAVHVYGPF